MTDTAIRIRDIQHYMYCPRRFALLSINMDWAENVFVVKANVLHEHVHDGTHRVTSPGVVSRSHVSLYQDEAKYNLFGVADCIEFIRNKNGVKIDGLSGNYDVRIVEYKPKAPKGAAFHETDAIQVFAQKICADFVWKCNSAGFVFYADSKRRVAMPFEEQYAQYEAILTNALAEMRSIIASGSIPERTKGQKCSGCSLGDLCFSKKAQYRVREEIEQINWGGGE